MCYPDDLKFLSDFCLSKYLVKACDSCIFSNQILLQKLLCLIFFIQHHPKFFGPNLFLEPNYLRTQNFLDLNFLWQKICLTHFFCMNYFFTIKFRSKIFDPKTLRIFKFPCFISESRFFFFESSDVSWSFSGIFWSFPAFCSSFLKPSAHRYRITKLLY